MNDMVTEPVADTLVVVIFEPGNRFVTTAADGRRISWLVEDTGLARIIPDLLLVDVEDLGPSTRPRSHRHV